MGEMFDLNEEVVEKNIRYQPCLEDEFYHCQKEGCGKAPYPLARV